MVRFADLELDPYPVKGDTAAANQHDSFDFFFL